MSRGSRRSGRSGKSRVTLGATLAALLALGLTRAVAGGGACSPAFWLNDRGSPGSSSPDTTGRAPTSRAPTKKSGGPSSTSTSQAPAGGTPAQSVHVELGTPADLDPSDDYLLIKPQYALSYSKVRNVANWVSWELNASYFGDVPRYKGKFITDTSLPDGFYRARHEDYVGTGYDRGHMVRSEERTRTPDDNKATFLLTNILPQFHDLNAGPWLRLEERCQELAQKGNHELFVMAGGVFGKRPQTIGRDVAVPDAFFKIVVVLGKGQRAGDVDDQARVIAVMMPNTTGIMANDWGQYRTTVDEIEKRTGYDFLTRVPEAVQTVLEARIDDGPTGDR